MSKLKKIPSFKNEVEERRFWEENDSSEYINWSKAQKSTFENLKPSTKTISLRLPETLLNDLKGIANQLDVPYQSLMKIMLSAATQKSIGSFLSFDSASKTLTKTKEKKRATKKVEKDKSA